MELVQKTEDVGTNLILGEECHVISSKNNGPRANLDYAGDYDLYDNLMLLCANDHKRVDELTDVYTVEKLKLFKQLHEEWVRTTLERDVIAFTNDKLNIKSLPKLTTGKQVVDIINGAHMFDFNNDELKTKEEAEEIGGFFDLLKETGDVLDDMSHVDVAKFGLDINETINKIQGMGFSIFGLRRKMRVFNHKKEDVGLFDGASLVIVRSDNPSIVSDFLIARFPDKSGFKF
jgi:hypothetical protein